MPTNPEDQVVVIGSPEGGPNNFALIANVGPGHEEVARGDIAEAIRDKVGSHGAHEVLQGEALIKHCEETGRLIPIRAFQASTFQKALPYVQQGRVELAAATPTRLDTDESDPQAVGLMWITSKDVQIRLLDRGGSTVESYSVPRTEKPVTIGGFEVDLVQEELTFEERVRLKTAEIYEGGQPVEEMQHRVIKPEMKGVVVDRGFDTIRDEQRFRVCFRMNGRDFDSEVTLSRDHLLDGMEIKTNPDKPPERRLHEALVRAVGDAVGEMMLRYLVKKGAL